MRKNFKAFSRGSLEFLNPDNPKVLAFLRRWENETIVMVANLSRFSQSAELDLSRFAGCVPMEVFSRNLFRPIRKTRYVVTLGPHAYYWFALQAPIDTLVDADLAKFVDDHRNALVVLLGENAVRQCRFATSQKPNEQGYRYGVGSDLL